VIGSLLSFCSQDFDFDLEHRITMELSISPLIETIKRHRQMKLSSRVHLELEQIVSSVLSTNLETIDILSLLIQVILLSDETPAHLIADLMVLLSQDNIEFLEKDTLSHASLFLKDYLKKDYIRGSLRRNRSN